MAKKTAKTGPKEPAFPLYGALSERQMRALGEKLDKLQDPNGFKHYQLLAKHADGPIAPLLWHLVRCGLVARAAQSAGLYRHLGEYIPQDVSAADVIAVLRHVPEDMGVLDRGSARDHVMLTPGALLAIDELLVHAHVADAAALRAVRAELPVNLQIAIDCVRRRAGEAIDPAHAQAILEHLALRHSADGLALNVDVPRIVDGAAVACRLADDAKVQELAALFGAPAAWAGLQLGWVRSHVAEFRAGADSMAQRSVEGLRGAELRDLLYLFGDGCWQHSSLLGVLDRREDEPAALLGAAEELLREGLTPFRVDAVQVKAAPEPRRGGGDDEDEGDEDYSGDDGDEDYSGEDGDADHEGDDGDEPEAQPDAGPDNDRVRALAEALTVLGIERLHARGQALPGGCDAAFDLVRLSDSDPAYVGRLRGALARLGPARAHAVIRRIVAGPYYYYKACCIADVCHDAAVVDEVLGRLDPPGSHVDAELLGFCGPEIIPTIMAHIARVEDGGKRTSYREAINYILARASAAGQAWDPALCEHIELAAIRFSYGGSKVTSVLAMLDALPSPRYEAVMRANLLRAGDEAVTIARCLRPDSSEALLEEAFAALLRRSAKISSGSLGERLRALGSRVVGPLRRAFGDTAAQSTLMRELERALDPGAFAEFTATLGRPIETREQELRRLCEGLPGPKVRIYRLKRAERAPTADEVGRIGGAPRGLRPADVPLRGGEAMVHVLTLDLARMPELAGYRAARSVSLFLPDPEDAEEHEGGELVWCGEAELGDAPGSVDDAAAIEVDALDVPTAIFSPGCEGDAARVRKLVYGSHGHAHGGPLWLQDGPEGVDPNFLFQFDEGLASINLGDCGVMYVFFDDISWQCH